MVSGFNGVPPSPPNITLGSPLCAGQVREIINTRKIRLIVTEEN